MKDGLLEKIKGGMRWTLRIIPYSRPDRIVGFRECEDLVAKNRLSIRGWDFPHISSRNDEHGGYVRGDKYLENWTDWATRQEFWRFYKSGQFIYMERLEEENSPISPNANFIDVISTIYTFTEYFVFAERMAGEEIFEGRCKVELIYNSLEPTLLHAGRNRVPFFDEKRFDGNEIKISRKVEHYGDTYGGRHDAQEAVLEFFDHFGWNPDASQISSEQDRYFSRDFRA